VLEVYVKKIGGGRWYSGLCGTRAFQ